MSVGGGEKQDQPHSPIQLISQLLLAFFSLLFVWFALSFLLLSPFCGLLFQYSFACRISMDESHSIFLYVDVSHVIFQSRQIGTDTDRQADTDRHRHRQTDTQTQTHTDTQTDTGRQAHTHTQADRAKFMAKPHGWD